MQLITKISALFLLTMLALPQAFSFDSRNIDAWNLGEEKLAIQGYDPVAYFPEGGSMAVKGDESLEVNHNGVLYHFASKKNMNMFLENTEKYEPAHGAWCSTGMAFSQKIDIDPKKFVVKGNRLFLFSFLNGSDARVMWLNDAASLERRADFNWKKVSNEGPRGLEKPFK